MGNLLIDFVHVDNLYRIRNCRGKRLEEVGELLIESNPALDAPSFEHERLVRKHIGDYTLFLTGMFPEYVATAASPPGYPPGPGSAGRRSARTGSLMGDPGCPLKSRVPAIVTAPDASQTTGLSRRGPFRSFNMTPGPNYTTDRLLLLGI